MADEPLLPTDPKTPPPANDDPEEGENTGGEDTGGNTGGNPDTDGDGKGDIILEPFLGLGSLSVDEENENA